MSNIDFLLRVLQQANTLYSETCEQLLATNIDWRHLVNRGERVLAIRQHRRMHGTSLLESKAAVDAFHALLNQET